MARQQDGQPDEVALAKARLQAAGEEADAFIRRGTKHAALVGVAASFGAGLLLSSGRLRPLRLARFTTYLPQILAYSRIGKEALATINQVLAAHRAPGAGGEPPPGR